MNFDTFKFYIENREDAGSHVSKGRKYVVISITDPGSKENVFVADPNRVEILSLQFSDFDIVRFPGARKYIKEVNDDSFFKPWIVLFDYTMAKQIFDFYQKHEKNVGYFLIHCEAGISRSPAVAAALCLYETGNDEYFFQKYLPNKHVYRTILEYLDNDGQLSKRICK